MNAAFASAIGTRQSARKQTPTTTMQTRISVEPSRDSFFVKDVLNTHFFWYKEQYAVMCESVVYFFYCQYIEETQ